MMEVSQSGPVDFKDMVQSKESNILPTADIVDENIEKFCLANNEEKNDSKNLKDLNKPTNGETDLDNILNKDENDFVNNLNTDNVNGVQYDEANLLANEDIDMFAEEYLKEIEEEDKTDEILSENNYEEDLLKDKDDVTNVQSSNTNLSYNDKEELPNSSILEEKETNKKPEELAKIIEDLKELNEKCLEENEITNSTNPDCEIEEEKDLENDPKADETDLEDEINEEKIEEVKKVSEQLEDNVVAEENDEKVSEVDKVKSKDIETNELDDNTIDSELMDQADLHKDEEIENEKDLKEKDEEKENENVDKTVNHDDNEISDNFNKKDAGDKKNSEEDTFMSELSQAIGDSDPIDSTIEGNKSKNKVKDIISIDNPLENAPEKDETNNSELEKNNKSIDNEEESTKVSDDLISKVDETIVDDKNKNKKRNILESLLNSSDDDDDDDIMLIDSITDKENEKNIENSDKELKASEDDHEKNKDKNNSPAEEKKMKSPSGSDSDDDDCVVLEDNKSDNDNDHDKDLSDKENKNKEKDIEDDIVDLLDDDKEEKTLEEETINDDDDQNEKSRKEIIDHNSQKAEEKQHKNEKTDGNKANEKDDYVSDDDIVLLDDDEKEDKTEEDPPKSALDGETIDDADQKEELGKEIAEYNSRKAEEKQQKNEKSDGNKVNEKDDYVSDDDIVLLDDDEKEDKTEDSSKPASDPSETNKNKEKEGDNNKNLQQDVEKTKLKRSEEDDDDDDDDIVVLLDDEKDQEKEDKKDNDKKTNDDNDNVEKNTEENPVEEIFSFDTSVSKRLNDENISKLDDDDDVVLINECSEKSNQSTEKKIDNETKKDEKIENKVDEKTPATANLDTDVEMKTNKVNSRASSRKSSKESEPEKDDVLVPDNSDNAQDKFPEKGTEDDNSSNNDVDNFLLKEVDPPQNSRSNDQDDNKSKYSQEVENSENSTEPPTKKIRTDGVGGDDLSQSSAQEVGEKKDVEISNGAIIERDKAHKRCLSSDNEVRTMKKSKIESTIMEDECKNEIVNKNEELKTLLIPAPNPIKKVDLNLDFLNRFKKSIIKMTKADLEELVLQKIVEAVIHKSEFSEMRDLIEKQEKIISTHRIKITEITKQFRDLEMVHNRVLKDLEMKNQQFIMPVKITRAVGLQVLIPKRFEQPANKCTTTNDRSNSGTSTTSPAATAAAAAAGGASNVAHTPEIAQPPVKRKCPQKVTPLRPDTNPALLNRNVIVQSGISTVQIPAQQLTNNTIAVQQNPLRVQQPKLLARSAPATPTTPQNPGVGVMNQQYLQVQHANLKQFTAQNQTAMQMAVRKSTPSRPIQQTQVQRLPVQQQKHSSPDRPRVPPMILKKTGANGRVLTVANPNQISMATQQQSTPSQQGSTTKSVIDLTDEDENAAKGTNNVLPALVAIPSAAAQHTRVTYVVKNGTTQRVAVTQNNNTTAIQRMTAAGIKTAQYAPKANQNIPVTATGPRLPTTNTIVRRTATTTTTATAVAAAAAVVATATHPAPLPKTPPALSNPGWKAAPPRPSIRINNIDSGIVISWTMDDLTDQHAEINSYQIYAYQETNAPPQVEAWRHVGDVKSMLLPMAVTLTQFQEGQRYYFAVRAVDMHSRCGPFSMPKTWV